MDLLDALRRIGRRRQLLVLDPQPAQPVVANTHSVVVLDDLVKRNPSP